MVAEAIAPASPHEQPLVMGDSREQAVADFRERLLGMAVKPLSVEADPYQPDPSTAAQAEFFSKDFQQNATFYVLPEIAEVMSEQLTGFEPLVSRGGQESRHGVFFGAFMFNDGSELQVAVKPFASEEEADIRQREGACLKDYFVNQAANKAGVKSLEGVGFMMGADGQPYSITVLQTSLNTMETVEWNKFFEDGAETTGMRQQLDGTADAAAEVHSKGNSLHADLTLRNVATEPDGGQMLIDWEFGHVSLGETYDADKRAANTVTDLILFMQSLIDAGLFERAQDDRWTAFRAIFLDKYTGQRLAIAGQEGQPPEAIGLVEAELVRVEQELETRMRSWH
jgi:hypothetical protein